MHNSRIIFGLALHVSGRPLHGTVPHTHTRSTSTTTAQHHQEWGVFRAALQLDGVETIHSCHIFVCTYFEYGPGIDHRYPQTIGGFNYKTKVFRISHHLYFNIALILHQWILWFFQCIRSGEDVPWSIWHLDWGETATITMGQFVAELPTNFHTNLCPESLCCWIPSTQSMLYLIYLLNVYTIIYIHLGSLEG